MATDLQATQVDLAGLMTVLGGHLYSTPAVAVRELVQNAHDSITRRRIEDPAFSDGRIDVLGDAATGTLIVRDDGAGMTRDEIDLFLATVGVGYTRGLRESDPSQDQLIGQFGLGFLSAFIIGERTLVRTASYRAPGEAHEYRSTTGERYSVEVSEPRGIGTEVELRLTDSHRPLADPATLETTVRRYCALLPVPVHVNGTHVNAEPPPWREDDGETTLHPVQRRKRALAFADGMDNAFRPLCTLEVAGGGVRGLLWVQDALTYGSSDNRRLSVYVRGMLLDDDARDLLPRWAGFVSGAVESEDLTPTASREDLQRDDGYRAAQEAIRDALVEGLSRVATEEPEAWARVLTRHNEALLGAALADERLEALLAGDLQVPTSEGEMTVRELVDAGGGRAHLGLGTGGFEEMRFRALKLPIATGTRYAVLPFVRRWCQTHGVDVVELGTNAGDRALFRRADLQEGEAEWLAEAFAGERQELIGATFEPAAMPFVLVPDREAELKARLEADEARERIASAVLHLAREHTATIDGSYDARLYVNVDAPAIAALLEARRDGRDTDVALGLLRAVLALMAAGERETRAGVDLQSALTGIGDAVKAAVNIWTWVEDLQRELGENGQDRLAELIGRLPGAVLADENAEVEAIVPEALALARALELPWVEIFIRHWHMQAVAGGFETLPQAIELLEFSHREEHLSCPQSVCTVQDVAIAYAGADGPGYAEERLAVAEEALGRIDPSWPCYSCIAGEKVDALDDAGRHEDAVAFAAEARAEIAAVGRTDAEHQICATDPLLALGRAEEALERLPKAGEEREDTFGRWDRLRRARVLLELGREDEARDALLPAEAAFSDPKYHFAWARVAGRVLDNDWHLGALLERMLTAQVELGRAWDGTRLATLHAELALDRGVPNTARHALETLREIAARLRDPERSADRIATLEAALAAAGEPRVELPDSAQALLAEEAGEDADPERDVERLLAARRRWPDDLDLAGQLYMALQALGRPVEGLHALRDFVDAHPDDSDALLGYGRALIESGAADEVEPLAARAEPLHGHWLRAQAAYAQGDAEAARGHAERIVEADAEALNARRLIAAACEELGDFEAALEHRDAVLAAMPDDDAEHDHWCRLIPATATGDWAAVRESGARLGMEFDSEDGPVDEAWSYVRLRFDARDIVLGLRTGPVTARVLTVAAAGVPQHAGDLVVFEPSPIGDTEEGQAHLFGVVTVLEEGPRRGFPFDGVYPGDEAWEGFVGGLREDGWIIDPRSTRDYAFEVDGEQRPAIFGYLAVPDDVELAVAHERLGELTAGWEQPFTWLPLAEAAGDESAAATQRAHADEFALY